MTTKIQLRGHLKVVFLVSFDRKKYFKLQHGCLDWAHLVLYAQRTASGCLSPQTNYWRVWTSAWTRRRGWGSGRRNMPQRKCSQSHRSHWIWHGLYWWLQIKHIYFFISHWCYNVTDVDVGLIVSVWQSCLNWEKPGLIHPLPHRLPKDGTIATHYIPRVREIFSFLNAITWWPVFKYYHLFSPILFSLVACLGRALASKHRFILSFHEGSTVIPLIFNYNLKFTYSECMVDSIMLSLLSTPIYLILHGGLSVNFPALVQNYMLLLFFFFFETQQWGFKHKTALLRWKHLAYSSAAPGDG